MSQLAKTLSDYWSKIQGSLFPWLEEELDPLTERQQQLVAILELIRIEEFLPCCDGHEGRPRKTRAAIARSFIAKMVYNIDTTTFLLERLKSDKNIRRICGWESVEGEKKLPKKKGRPKKSEEQPESEPELTRIQKQRTMTLEEMINDLPTACDKGAKKDSKGNTMYWTGYKLHVDTIDGCIPVSALVTSASLNDSQAAIPLATITRERIINCYDLMDAAYDVPDIIEHSQSLGHIPLVDKNPRRNKELKKALEAESLARKTLNFVMPETLRYNARSTAERANSRLKDEFGACKVRVRGHMKVACHLLFGVLTLAADQLMQLVT